MKTNEITKFLKKNKKQILIAVGILVAVTVVWIVVKKLWQRSENNENPEDITGTQVTVGIDFSDLAKRMLQAFTADPGTDEDAVYTILGQLKTQADWVNLKRKYEKAFEELDWFSTHVFSFFERLTGNLPHDLQSELTKKELARCRSILEDNGITPDF